MKRTTTLTLSGLLFLAGSLNATTYYVATNGNDSNSGTSTDAPFATPQHAVAVSGLTGGDTIYIRGGTYALSANVSPGSSKVGTPGNYIKFWAYPGEHPIFDYSAMSGSAKALEMRRNYWWAKGIEVKNGPNTGILIAGNGVIIEGCVVHDCGFDGIVLGSSSSICSNATIKNCDSYHNVDLTTGGEDGDGFAGKGGCGSGNIFVGCRSWMNSDDGWDFYDSGAKSVTFTNCWSFYNGTNDWGIGSFQGDGNGYKLGGASTSVGHTLVRCLAFHNRIKGFDYNNSAGPHSMKNCTAFRNTAANFKFPVTPSGGVINITNCISYAGNPDYDIVSGSILVNNSWNLPVTVSDADFVNLDPWSATNARLADFSLPTNGLARLVAGSDLIDAGVTNDCTVGFYGNAPDLGAYEFVPSGTAPVANFTASPTNGTAPLLVTFTDTSSGTAPLSLSWNLGDSFTTNTSGGASFVHSYAVGTYTVTLLASNSAGTSTLVSNNLIVATAPPPPQNVWLNNLQSSPTGFSFNVNGLTSHGLVIIQASDDLTGWTPQYTNPAVTGTLPYFDLSATNLPARFYRAEEQ